MSIFSFLYSRLIQEPTSKESKELPPKKNNSINPGIDSNKIMIEKLIFKEAKKNE